MSRLSVAPDIRSLKGRLDRFVTANRTAEGLLLDKLLNEHFRGFESVGIIGGLVRDVARGGRYAFKSDLDLVIQGDPTRVAALAKRVGAIANRFGGYGFTVGPWKIDFWALHNTWAAMAGHVAVHDFADVIQCTFFDWDAVVYDLTNKRVVCDKAYLERIRSRHIEINLRPNPGEIGNLLRATRRILRWNLVPGPRLSDFVLECLDDVAFSAMRAKESCKYSDRVLDDYVSAAELKAALLLGSKQDRLIEQMDLPFEHVG